MKTANLALLLLLAAPGSRLEAETWMASELHLPRGIAVAVDVIDDAKGGCWTNLGESRSYAEDKLRERGFEVENQASVRIALLVHANRSSEGCFGRLAVYATEMVSTSYSPARGRAVIASGRDAVFVGMETNSINSEILDATRAFINDLGAKVR